MTIWHNNTDLPKKDSSCVIVFIAKYGSEKVTDSFFRKLDEIFIYGIGSFFIKASEIKRWAYTNDLLKEAMK